MRVSNRVATFGAKEAAFFIANALLLTTCRGQQTGSPEAFQTQTPDTFKLNSQRDRAVEFIGTNNEKYLGDAMSSFSVTFPANENQGIKQNTMSGTIFEIKSNLPDNLPLTLALYVPDAGNQAPVPVVLNHIASDSLGQGTITEQDGTPLTLYGVGALPMEESYFQQIIEGGLTLTPGSFDRYLKKDQNGNTIPLYTLWFKDLTPQNVDQFILDFSKETDPKKRQALLLSHIYGLTFNDTSSDRSLTIPLDNKNTAQTNQVLDFLVRTFFGPNMIAHAAPAEPTEIAPTQVPTPAVETGPEGTVVQKDYLDNKYTVDENGVPSYWWNSDANDGKGEWEKFQPVSFTGEYVANDSELPVVPNIIYITSGYMEHVVTEAGLPENPNALYVRDTKDWEQFYLDGFDQGGYRAFMVNREYYQNEIKSPDRYPFQPTNFTFMLEYNGETYKVITQTLNVETSTGEKLKKPVFLYFPESIWNNDFHTTSGKLFERLSQQFEGFSPLIALPLIEFDSGKIDQDNWNTNLFPDQKQVLEDFNAFYEIDANSPFFAARKDLLERIMNGDENAIIDISKFLYPPVISTTPIIP